MKPFSAPAVPQSDATAGPFLLPAATVREVLPAIPGGEENLLPVSALHADLRVEITRWSGSNPTPERKETLTLLWNGVAVASKEWTAPIAENDLFILLPKALLLDGVHELRYDVRLGTGNVEGASPLTLTIDTEPPLYPQSPDKLKFGMDVIIGGITRQYLELNGDQVGAEVPDYGLKPGDRLVAYWEELPDGNGPVLDVELTADRKLSFSGDMIRQKGNGARFITYRLQDRAGNISSLSRSERLDVRVDPPALRPVPSVVQAMPGSPGTLNITNYSGGVTVRIPAQTDGVTSDQVTVHWQGFASLGSVVVSQPITPGGWDFRIPGEVLPSNMGRDVQVWYSVAFAGLEPELSEVYHLRVQKIAAQSFPRNVCQQAQNNTLSLARVPAAGADVIQPAWVFKSVASGMHINMWITGIHAVEGTVREDLLQAQPVPRNSEPVSAVIPKAVLEQLKINSTFATHVSVSFDEGESWVSFVTVDLVLQQ